MRVSVKPVEGRVKGEEGEAVTPEGSPYRLTVTVPENPFSGVNVSPTCAFELAEIETENGLAAIAKEGGGGGVLRPREPPQPKMTASTRNMTAR